MTKFKSATTAKISEKLAISLTDEIEFYKSMSKMLGDFELGFVVRSIEQIVDPKKIYVLQAENSVVLYLGFSSFKICDDLHHAIWAFYCLSFILKVKLDETSERLGQFLANVHKLPLKFGTSKIVQNLASKI